MSGMGRREFVALLAGAAAAWPLAARAQQSSTMRRIGFLGPLSERTQLQWTTAFLKGLRDHGWIEGTTISFDYRWAEGRSDRYAELAAELVRREVNIIVTAGTEPAIAVKQATASIPIVFAAAGDPVGTGLVGSLARPGGNVTGLSNQSADINGKRIDLLREAVPGLRKLAVMANVGSPIGVLEIREVEDAGRTSGLEVVRLEIRGAEDIGPAIETVKGRAHALIVVTEPLVNTNRMRINTLALAARLPTMHGTRTYVEAGGLMSYGADYNDLFRRAAGYVDKILRGAKPRDLPVEQPTKFQLLINLTTAKALGLTVPDKLLVRADEVIE
jgi:putative tryptophan/tyrosine transport system substrate-binding protein